MVGRRVLAKLTFKSVANLKCPGRHSDGYGLYLIVTPARTKHYAFLYRREGRSHELGLGSVITTTLAQARQKAADCRALLAQGLDPLEARKSGAERRKNQRTFGECASQLIASKRASWRSHKYYEDWRTSLDRPCALINQLPVVAVDTAAVVQVLQPLWSTKRETATRLRGRIEATLDYAKAIGLRSGENPARWRGHLDVILSKRTNLARAHHSAMAYPEVPQFVQGLRAQDTLTLKALEWLILTAARLSEATGATWDEIDCDAAIWTIPAQRMKAGREHRIPLSIAAMGILRDAAEFCTSSQFIFPGRSRGRPLSGSGFRKVLPPGVTIHGFRSAFRDWCGNETNYPRELAEQSLAHAVGNAAEQAYRRGDALEKRRGLMQAWADFCASGNSSASL